MVTLEDVAREAGVSVSTASRTLNGQTIRVSDATRHRVSDAAQRLGYAPNSAAQALTSGRSPTLGLITVPIPEDYQNPVTAGIFRSATERDLMVITAITQIADIYRTREVVRKLRGQRPSVILAVGTDAPDTPGVHALIEELQRAEADGCRVVLIGIRSSELDAVVVDDRKAGGDMARELMRLGYRNFGVFAGRDPSLLSTDRTEGFCTAVEAAGISIPPDRILHHEFNHDGGYRAAGEVLRRPGIEAVFCVNDAMAIGASVRFREAGLRVGPDIAVAGCDDIPALRDIDPPLTTVHLPWNQAAEKALSMAGDHSTSGRTSVLTGHVVVRRSTPGLSNMPAREDPPT